MEIYNEKIFDLLSDLSNPDQAMDYTIAEEKNGRGTFVRGLTEIEVKSENEAFNLLFSGELCRTTATHKLNRRSNRSHSIFTVYLQQRQRSGISERVVHSKLHLVDLAGSERLKKTMDASDGLSADSQLKKESMSINQSLTYLEQCVIALARRSSHVPYRQSKLTNILKDCLGANCNTLMISCIWGESDHLEETISTLRLASRMMKVQNETATVETIDASALIKKQAKLIKALKQELLMHDALVERTGVGYEPYTPEQQTGITQMLEKYVEAKEVDEEDVLSINSFRQMLEISKQFKRMVLNARSDASIAREEALAKIGGGYDLDRPASTGTFGLSSQDFNADSKLVDEFDPRSTTYVGEDGAKRIGFSLGTATNESRPSAGVEGASRYAESKALGYSIGAGNTGGRGSSMAGFPSDKLEFYEEKASSESSLLMEGERFAAFIKSDGNALYREFVETKGFLKEARNKIKEYSATVNDSKASIDKLQEELEIRKSSRIELLRKSGLKASATEDIVDEEEYKIMKDLKEAKRHYKNSYEQLQKWRSSLSQSKENVEISKSALIRLFTQWSSGGALTASIDPKGFGDTIDALDDQEAFDRLEVERVVANDPDSLSFFQAQKTRRAHMTQNGANLKQMQKNKRLA